MSVSKSETAPMRLGRKIDENVEKSPNPKIHYVFWIVIPKIGINLGIRVMFLILPRTISSSFSSRNPW